MKTEKEPRLPSVWEPVFALAVLVAVLAALMAKNAGYLCRVFAVVALALVLGGCKSTVPGRVTTFDWDSRSPEQRAASVPAARDEGYVIACERQVGAKDRTSASGTDNCKFHGCSRFVSFCSRVSSLAATSSDSLKVCFPSQG